MFCKKLVGIAHELLKCLGRMNKTAEVVRLCENLEMAMHVVYTIDYVSVSIPESWPAQFHKSKKAFRHSNRTEAIKLLRYTIVESRKHIEQHHKLK